jgi:hypothetical protein
MEQAKSWRWRHGRPAGLSSAKSADVAYGSATQQRAEHRAQSARRSSTWSINLSVSGVVDALAVR